MAEVIERAPAVVQTAEPNIPTAVDKSVIPVQNKKELDDLNPVIQQTKLAQETFGLPSHAVPSSEQMDHVGERFRKSRETAIARETGQPLDQFDVQPQDIGGRLDPSMVEAGEQVARQEAPAARAPGVLGGADLPDLEKAFQMKKQGAADTLAQQSNVDTMAEVNAIVQEQAQSDVDNAFLDDLNDASNERNKIANDVMAISRKFIQNKIDPGRWYANRSTNQKIGITISAFLSGFGGSDAVLNMVNSAISNDIEAQKHDFDRSKGSIKNMIGMVDKIYGQDVDKAKVVRSIMLENISNQLKVNSAKAKTSDAKSKMKTALAGIEIEKQKLFEQIAQDRFKATQAVKKDQKLGSEEKKNLFKMITSRDALSGMIRAFSKPGMTTVSLIGDNDFTMHKNQFVLNHGFLLSGANLPDKEKEMIEAFVVDIKKGSAMGKKKLFNMKRIIDKGLKIFKAKTVEDIEKISGGKRNKFFKPGT